MFWILKKIRTKFNLRFNVLKWFMFVLLIQVAYSLIGFPRRNYPTFWKRWREEMLLKEKFIRIRDFKILWREKYF